MADISAPAAPAASPAPIVDNTPKVTTTQEVIKGAPVDNGPAPVTKAEIKRLKSLKIKVDGNEVDEALPFEMDDTPENRDYMTRQLQMAKMGSKRAQEAAESRKKLEDVANYLAQAKGDKKHLRKLIKELGGDEKELAAAIIEEEIANSQKSPELLAKEKAENELKELKEQREREKEEFNSRELQRLQEQEIEKYDVTVSQALEKAELPKKPYVVRKMADYMLLALENGIELSAQEVAQIVKQEMHSDMQEVIQALGEDRAESFIGKEMLTKIRKRNVAKAKAAGVIPKADAKGVDVGAKKTETVIAPVQKKSFKQLFGV